MVKISRGYGCKSRNTIVDRFKKNSSEKNDPNITTLQRFGQEKTTSLFFYRLNNVSGRLKCTLSQKNVLFANPGLA